MELKLENPTVNLLCELAERCIVGAKRFEKFAYLNKEPITKSLFMYLSSQRREFAKSIKQELKSMFDLDDSSNKTTAEPLSWTDSPRYWNENLGLRECEWQEKMARALYQRALQSITSNRLRPLLTYHLYEISMTCQTLEELQNQSVKPNFQLSPC